MPDESFFNNTFHGEIGNLIQAHLVQMAVPKPARPMEVPRPPRPWINRDELLDETRRHIDTEPGSPLVITGPSGIGKSALAAMAAEELRDRFSDGQLYIDLENEDMYSAARAVLLRLGEPKDQLADTFGGLLSHYRSATRDRSVLVIVDGAESATEGLHFEPSSGTSRLVVFALGAPPDLAVRRLRMSELSAPAAVEMLLAATTGVEDSTALALVTHYDSYPGTIRRIAGLIRARSHGADQDGDSATSLLDYPATDLLDATYHILSPSAAWLYRLLSVLPGAEFEKSILKVFESPSGASSGAYEELVNAQLVTETRDGWCLVEPSVSRDASRRAELESLPIELLAAMRASLRWYVKRAQLADRAIMGDRLRRAAVPADVDCPPFRDGPEALAWFQANHTALYTAIQMAVLHDWNEEAWALAEAMWAFFNNVSYPEEAERCYQIAVEATTQPVDRARMLLFLGRVRLELAKYRDAEAVLRESHSLAVEADDLELIESSLALLGRTNQYQGRYHEAIEFYTEALRNAQQGEHNRAAALQLLSLGRTHRDLGDLGTAERYFERALAAFTRIKDGRHVLLVETDLAVLKAELGVPGAVEKADQVIGWLRQAGLAKQEAAALERLAAALEGEERRRRLELALEVFERVGSVEARRIRRMLR
ncbi:tetratricopeptide repeat protein [Glycomyces buryatensis]|uniref:tetratricopeptide repeat protein n=1 Tax=Glycomyces buryatensis TaxID=2570927 RepID=UPI0014562F43|nr:tetratricopeptide repeat protein [Glycomyces buryatensis]